MAELKPEHVEFVRAVVALARQHKVGMLDVTFRDSASAIHSGPDFWNWKQMRMQWSEGRHGDTARITLKHEAETQVDERDPRGVAAVIPAEELTGDLEADTAAVQALNAGVSVAPHQTFSQNTPMAPGKKP